MITAVASGEQSGVGMEQGKYMCILLSMLFLYPFSWILTRRMLSSIAYVPTQQKQNEQKRKSVGQSVAYREQKSLTHYQHESIGLI